MSPPILTPLQRQTVGAQPTDWSQTLSFDQFDPALGDLQAIEVGVTVDVAGNVALKNLDGSPAGVSATLRGVASATGPGGGWLSSASAFAMDEASLAPGEGASLTMAGSGADSAGRWVASDTWSGFTGTGSVDLTLSDAALLDVHGPANFSVESHAVSGAAATLQYAYTPPVPPSTPPPGGWISGVISSMLTDFATVLLPGSWRPDPSVTVTQTFEFADRTTGWTDSVPIARFDPSVGTLEWVGLSVTADIQASVTAQNDESTPATVSTMQSTLVLLGTYPAAGTSVSHSMNLPAGESETDTGLAGTGSESLTLVSADEIAPFIGQGDYQVPLSATGSGSLTGPGNMSAELHAQAGATVTVTYRYMPAGVTAQSVAWWNPAGGSWDDGANWGQLVPPPQPGDDVAITAPGTYTITLDTAQTIHSLVMDAPGATLVLDADLLATGDIILDAGTIEFAGGKLSSDHFTMNGGLARGNEVEIDANSGFVINAGAIVAGAVTLGNGAAILGGTTVAATSVIPTAVIGSGGVTAATQLGTLATLGDSFSLRDVIAAVPAGAPGADLLPPLTVGNASDAETGPGSGGTLSGWIHDHPGMLPGILAIAGHMPG